MQLMTISGESQMNQCVELLGKFQGIAIRERSTGVLVRLK
jgi:predicted Zn-dependent protease with MMP-like domain